MDLNSTLWVTGRASGMVGLILLSASAAMGLALSMKVRSPRFPRWLTTELHRYATVLSLVVIGIHLGTLWLDSEAGISLLDLVIPFRTSWEPFAVGIGVIGLEVALAVWLTSRFQNRIGYPAWQMIHRSASVAWVLILLHGVLSGTDTGTTWGIVVYAVCAGMVVGLLVPRVVLGRSGGDAPVGTAHSS